jgi:hypothetical protein
LKTNRRANLAVIATLLGLESQTALPCPGFYQIPDKHPWTDATDIRNVALYSYSEKDGWRNETMQIVPLDETMAFDTGRFGKLSKKNSQTPWPITSRDQIVVKPSALREPRKKNTPLPCQGKSAIELYAPLSTARVSEVASTDAIQQTGYAYLIDCQTKPAAITVPNHPVKADTTVRQISSPEYIYTYHPKNELLYESLVAKSSKGELLQAAYQSDVSIKLDIQNFFTLEFNNDDVETYVIASQPGSLGLIEGVAFFLRLFAIKIDLKISTVASFFEKSASIPMIIDVPRNAPDILNPGSGPLYSFKIDQATFEPNHTKSTMPIYSRDLIKNDLATRTKMALQHCGPTQCRFRLMGRLDVDPVALDLLIARSSVEMGFFPNLVQDVKQFRSEQNWKEDPKADRNSRALFFETSGLSKGRYLAETWIIFGDDTEIKGGCPIMIQSNDSVL